MSLGSQIDAFFAAKREIFAAFGYVEQWREFVLDDARVCPWMLRAHFGRSDGLVAWTKPETPFTVASIEDGDTLYTGAIYTYRHLDRYMWSAQGLTMVLVDTQSDGNIYLTLFADALRVTDPALLAAWESR